MFVPESETASLLGGLHVSLIDKVSPVPSLNHICLVTMETYTMPRDRIAS